MYNGLEAERGALHRQRTVAWAWIKARSIMRSRAASTHATLISSVLLSSDCSQAEEISSWRESLAAFNYRSLSKQICDQFYDVSILTERHGTALEPPAAEGSLRRAVPSYCAGEAKAQLMEEPGGKRASFRARIMSAVLPDRSERRGAVLLSIKNRAA